MDFPGVNMGSINFLLADSYPQISAPDLDIRHCPDVHPPKGERTFRFGHFRGNEISASNTEVHEGIEGSQSYWDSIFSPTVATYWADSAKKLRRHRPELAAPPLLCFIAGRIRGGRLAKEVSGQRAKKETISSMATSPPGPPGHSIRRARPLAIPWAMYLSQVLQGDWGNLKEKSDSDAPGHTLHGAYMETQNSRFSLGTSLFLPSSIAILSTSENLFLCLLRLFAFGKTFPNETFSQFGEHVIIWGLAIDFDVLLQPGHQLFNTLVDYDPLNLRMPLCSRLLRLLIFGKTFPTKEFFRTVLELGDVPIFFKRGHPGRPPPLYCADLKADGGVESIRCPEEQFFAQQCRAPGLLLPLRKIHFREYGRFVAVPHRRLLPQRLPLALWQDYLAAPLGPRRRRSYYSLPREDRNSGRGVIRAEAGRFPAYGI
ncbi:hypothetical protein AAG570_001030 [Ranatra chinensis]|uniref:Uncharacterized protein n=1 Tax=Ranatra chinensis TaxID=642074 RepID=A0ABD0YAW5_9HEMI